jgi:hypothetical protein
MTSRSIRLLAAVLMGAVLVTATVAPPTCASPRPEEPACCANGCGTCASTLAASCCAGQPAQAPVAPTKSADARDHAPHLGAVTLLPAALPLASQTSLALASDVAGGGRCRGVPLYRLHSTLLM